MRKSRRNWTFYGLIIPVIALAIVALVKLNLLDVGIALAILNLLDVGIALAILNLLGIALICILITRLSVSLEEAAPCRAPADVGLAEKIAELDRVSADIARTSNETFDLLAKWANFLTAHAPEPPTSKDSSPDPKEGAQERIAELHHQGQKPDRIAEELKMSRDQALLEVWRLRRRDEQADGSVDAEEEGSDS